MPPPQAYEPQFMKVITQQLFGHEHEVTKSPVYAGVSCTRSGEVVGKRKCELHQQGGGSGREQLQS